MNDSSFEKIERDVLDEVVKSIYENLYNKYFNKRLPKVEKEFFSLVNENIPDKYRIYKLKILSIFSSYIPLGVNVITDDLHYILVDDDLMKQINYERKKKKPIELLDKTKLIIDDVYLMLVNKANKGEKVDVFDFFNKNIPENIECEENIFIRHSIGNRVVLDENYNVVSFKY